MPSGTGTRSTGRSPGHRHHGSVVRGTGGCGGYGHLVVSGPHRGQVRMVSDVGAAPFAAESGCTTAAPGFAGRVPHRAADKPWYDAG
ncbi:hypothetical protein [Streptomyces sp. Tu 3180]|uniref:hypothetical protein n=1 Tax=Streptomyces sp. Tu 3180 TaxID=2682611 RepID=UPI001357E8DD|nr:hypothetical protein GL259_18810 [Streptomyces sp. Tu 3180]